MESRLPWLLMGPMVRRAAPEKVIFQLASSAEGTPQIDFSGLPNSCEVSTVRLGKRLYWHLISVTPKDEPFSADTKHAYTLSVDGKDVPLAHLAYKGKKTPEVVIPAELTRIFHGSCRNPHHDSPDSLPAADNLVEQCRISDEDAPSLLLLSGDQVYADDVAGPMLLAIYELMELLGIYREHALDIALPEHVTDQLYTRDGYLPKTLWHQLPKTEFAYWLRRDRCHFSSIKAANHLIAFEEFVALYLLNFSAECWQWIKIDEIYFAAQNVRIQSQFEQEKKNLTAFAQGLAKSERLFANVASLMMFDDHDVTDDWNLTAAWEEAVYGHPVSRRVIANGMLSYWLFQGWGNDGGEKSDQFHVLMTRAFQNGQWHFKEIDKALFEFAHWHYELNTTPKLVMLDTRTHRWRNEQNFNEPSGLMDWERLSELEESLISTDSVLLVSPAPVFGVKSIEAIQAIFNLCGQPLLVDVENWMAHEGSAKKLLNIFRRTDTPVETIILSGDVHYSFCFSVQARFSEQENRIWQLTASGIKNEFPPKAIRFLDRLDSWLYHPRSPLNLFTKRWQMKVEKHDTDSKESPHLVAKSGIGLIELNANKLARYRILHGDNTFTEFSVLDDKE